MVYQISSFDIIRDVALVPLAYECLSRFFAVVRALSMEAIIDHLAFVEITILKEESPLTVLFTLAKHADISVAFFIEEAPVTIELTEPPLTFHNL